jgi:hypothetical protein
MSALMPKNKQTLNSKKVFESVQAQAQEEFDLSDLQLFVQIYFEEVQNTETNYKGLLELIDRDFFTIKKQVMSKLSSARQTDAASFLRVTMSNIKDSPYTSPYTAHRET